MFSGKFAILAALCGTLFLACNAGCAGNKLRDERDSLLQQNQTLEEQLRAAKIAAEDARACAASLQAALAAAQSAPPSSTAPAASAAPTGLEGEAGVEVGKNIHGEQVIALSGDVLFDSGKATIKPAFKKTLNKVAAVMKSQYPNAEFRIEGHTDSVPIHNSKWEDNWDLGAARACAVALYLIGQGIPKKSLYIASFADNEPNARDPNNFAANRRVEIVVVK